MANNTVTIEELSAVLSAGAAQVTHAYTQFRTVFPDYNMAEIGLTDLFMMGAGDAQKKLGPIDQQTHKPTGKDLKLDWSRNENISGSDFELSTLLIEKNVPTPRPFYFQAKIAKKSGDAETFADVLYKSKMTQNGQTRENLQYKLLVDWADRNKGYAFYVIYDVNKVYWINVKTLNVWLTHAMQPNDQNNTQFAIQACRHSAFDNFQGAYRQWFI